MEKLQAFWLIIRMVVEVASFDIQKIRNPAITGKEYLEGDQPGFPNVREYIFRDEHTWQHCRGEGLNLHHKESCKIGDDRTENPITLCETGHKAYHRDDIKLSTPRSPGFRGPPLWVSCGWAVYNRLKEKRPNTTLTYGYLTKNTRIKPAGKNPTSTMPGIAANLKDIRTDEQYRSAISKRRQEEEQPGTAYRQRVFPLGVDYQENTGFIFGRRTSRYFDIRQLDGIRVPAIRN